VIVAAHQPHFLPWLGYLGKVAACDLFVVMDDLQYEAQNFQNRNRVKINHGATWLTVPLERGPQHERICDKRIDNRARGRHHWQARAWRTLRIHYGAAPYWRRYEAELATVFASPWHDLVTLDLHMLALHCRWLGITTPIVRASSLGLRGQKTERLIALCRAVGATTYLSGAGGSRAYLDVDAFAAAGLRVAWQHFSHPRYPQRYPERGFLSHLAALDLLLNCGPDAREILRRAMAAPRRMALAQQVNG
jgi:WbqC-like protein family